VPIRILAGAALVGASDPINLILAIFFV